MLNKEEGLQEIEEVENQYKPNIRAHQSRDKGNNKIAQ